MQEMKPFFVKFSHTPGRKFARFAHTGVTEKFLGLEHFTGDLKFIAMSSPKDLARKNASANTALNEYIMFFILVGILK
jgi:hypothetical protein